MARVHLLSVDRTLCKRISDAMGAATQVEMIHSLDEADLEGPSIIVLDHASIPADRSLATVLAELVQGAPGRAVVVATDEWHPGAVMQAVRAGASDVLPRGANPGEINEVLTRMLNTALASQGRLGRLTLVLGTSEEATAILASDLALAHSLAQVPSLLIDCSLPSSTAEAYLDLKVDYGVASAVADIDRLDASLLSDALAHHEASNLALLTLDGGTGSEPSGVAPNDIVGLIQLLRASCGHIVLCAGSLRNGGLLRELASQAQAIEVVCSQSIRELDACRRLLDRIALDTASAERMRLMVWDYDPRVLLDGRRMAEVLGIDPVITIPIDRVRLRNALNAGRPMMVERDGGQYVQAVRRAAGRNAPVKGSFAGFDKVRRKILQTIERTP